MREFIVTLKGGTRYTVKADWVRQDAHYLALCVARPPAIGDPQPSEDVVALFDRGQVAVVVARDHLVSEEKGDPVDPHFVADDDPIPF